MATTHKTIEIIVAPDGQSRVETKGFVGTDCRDASRFVELVLGKQVDEQLKSEFHQTATARQETKQGY